MRVVLSLIIRTVNRSATALLLLLLGLLPTSQLSAGLILAISNSTISGAPLDQVTLNGTLDASGVTVSIVPSAPPWTLSGSALVVIGLLVPSGLSIPDGGNYSGPIALVQIAGSTPDGSYPTNSFSISFDDDNGRRAFSNSVNLTVDVQSQVPEPSTVFLLSGGLVVLGLARRLAVR